MTEPELMTVDNAARAMSIGRSTMYLWIARGLVPTFRVNGVVRIPRTALMRMIEAQVEGATAPTPTAPARPGKGPR